MVYAYVRMAINVKVREVEINGVIYYIHDKEDEIRLTHMLSTKGYTVEQIAKILKINKKKVNEYLQDCW